MKRIRSIGLGAVLAGALPCVAVPAVGAGAADPVRDESGPGDRHAQQLSRRACAQRSIQLLEQKNPKLYQALEYRHRPLDAQLNSGVRSDRIGHLRRQRGQRRCMRTPWGSMPVGGRGQLPKDPDFDPQGLMKMPGFKVLHVQELDYRSTCQQLVACFKIVSARGRRHTRTMCRFSFFSRPSSPSCRLNITRRCPEKFTASTFDALDAEIRSVFKPGEMITPDLVRGKHATLEEAVLPGWLADLGGCAREQVVFLMDQRPVGPVYLGRASRVAQPGHLYQRGTRAAGLRLHGRE